MEVVLLASDKGRKIKTSVLAVWIFLHTIMSQFWEHMRQVLNWPPCELLATTPLIHAVACGVWTWCLEFGPIYRRCQYLWHRHLLFPQGFLLRLFASGCLTWELLGSLPGIGKWSDGYFVRWCSCVLRSVPCISQCSHAPHILYLYFFSFFSWVSHFSCICVSVFLISNFFPFVCGCGP